MDKKDKINVVFAPGCFDSFEGTQEELDALLKEIQDMADSGELFENAREVDYDQLCEEDNELAAKLLAAIENQTPDRSLH